MPVGAMFLGFACMFFCMVFVIACFFLTEVHTSSSPPGAGQPVNVPPPPSPVTHLKT